MARRRRARVGLPLQPARLPRAAAPRRRRHRADRPDRAARPRRASATRWATPSGSCTPPPRTSPAWPRSACARAGCSTPSSPAGCSATSGSRSARWSRSTSASGWRRATRPPTGRPARCPTTGWSTPPSTSSCSSRCATSWPALLEQAGKTEWARAGVRGRPHRARRRPPRVDPWRRTSGIHRLRNRRQLADRPRAVARPGRVRRRARHRARDGCCPTPPSSTPRRPTRPARATSMALPVFGGPRQRRRVGRWFGALTEGRDLPDDELPPVTARRGRRHAGAVPLARARPGRGRPAGRAPGRPSPSSPSSTRCWRRTCSPPTSSAGCAGSRRRRSTRTPSPTGSPGSAPVRGRSG